MKNKSSFQKRFSGCGLVLGVILALVLIGTAIQFMRDAIEPEQSSSEKQSYAEGEGFHVGCTSYIVWQSWWSCQLSENRFLNQRPNATYLFVELTVRNDDKTARMIPPFTLIDDGGAEHRTSSGGWAVEGSISALDTLNPFVTKQGFIVFDVPRNQNYHLKVSGGFWSGRSAYIQLVPKASKEP